MPHTISNGTFWNSTHVVDAFKMSMKIVENLIGFLKVGNNPLTNSRAFEHTCRNFQCWLLI